ncbi:MAG: hypothetical protein HXY21_12290, partial [Parvularculaceae bacterium]|nr:hypothetical protein [Parvularculaceae bacterium]
MNSQSDSLPAGPDTPPTAGETLPARAEDEKKTALRAEDLVVKGGDPKALPPPGLKAAPLLFGAFLIIALAAAGVYLARSELRKEARPPLESPAPATETTPATTLQLPENSRAAPHAAPTPDPSKIFNTANDAMKAGAEAIGRAGPSVEGSITELPPPPSTPRGDGANEGLQNAAKDAAKLFAPKEGDQPTIDLSAPPTSAPAETPDRGAAADYLTPPVAAAIDNARLAEEVEGLKRALADVAALNESLAAARKRSDEQAGEIARLNDELRRLKGE